MPAVTRRVDGPLSAPPELEAFLRGRTGDGAVVSFTGLARATSRTGEPVTRLRLDWYPGMTERSLRTIAEAGAVRFGVADLRVVHRCGAVLPGETIVRGGGRPPPPPCLLAADHVMDRLKTDAAFWKWEEGPGGGRWIEPAESDHADTERWSD